MKRLFAALALTNTVLAFAAAPVTKLTTLHSFVTTDGSHPSGRLVEGEDGVFFGVTADGGARNGGTVYKITASGVLTTLFDFAQFPNALDGEQPIGGLVRGADGDFYGVTVSGGDGFSFDGEIFRITATGTLTVLHSFAGTDGRNPSELMLASDGNFYGMTSDGGAAGGGTIYRMTPAGALNTLHDFPNDATEVGGGLSQLVEGPGMVLYGTAQTGGYTVPDIEGTFFSVSTTGTFNVLHRFLLYPQRPNGVVLGPDGALYGSTFNGQGFKLTTGGAITTLHELLGCSCGTPLGGTPVGNFLWRDDGNFYGVTTNGGVNHWGSIYSMSPTGALEPLHSFNGTDEGMHPSTTLIEGRDGRLYGTTFGFNTAGTVYKLAFLPAAPAGLSAAPGNPGEVALNWGGTRSANTYNVYRGTVSGGLAATPVLSGVTTTSATITGLTNGTNYFFAVAAVNEAGVGSQSAEASAMPIAAPTNLTGTVANGDVTLTWTAAEGASSYAMFQSTVAASFPATPTVTGISANLVIVTGLPTATTLYFKVVSVYGATLGPASNTFTVTVPAPVVPAPPPATPPPATPPPAPAPSGGGGGGLDMLLLAVLLLTGSAEILRRIGRT